jgi:tetratricopeptide (TPR) repeat protein
VAEFLLYGRTDYQEVLEFAASLRDAGERNGSPRAIAFAATVAGEAALLAGDLDMATTRLSEGVDLHRRIGANAGEALSLQRLAEVHIEREQHEEALRLLDTALPLARWSALAHHLVQRIYGTMIRATTDRDAARLLVDQAAEAIGPSDTCIFCTVMIAVPSAIACADVGDLDDAVRHLAMAEMSAMAWQGTAWPGALAEVRAHIAAAEGRDDDAATLRAEAADLFTRAGQPLDARRCSGAPAD